MERAVKKKVELLDGVLALDLLVNDRSGHVAYAVWPSSYHVAAFLAIIGLEHHLAAISDVSTCLRVSQRILSEDSKTRRQLFVESRRKRALHNLDVLELGSGTGVLGLALHALGARVVLTDQAKCMDLLVENVKNHVAAGSGEVVSLTCAALDWKEWSSSSLKADGWLANIGTGANDTSPHNAWDCSSSRFQLLVACDCVYDTTHIGSSPLVPIIQDFIAGVASGSQHNQQRRAAIIAMETRDADIESNFEHQLASITGLRVTVALEAPCPHPSEGNDTPASEARYRILVVTAGTSSGASQVS